MFCDFTWVLQNWTFLLISAGFKFCLCWKLSSCSGNPVSPLAAQPGPCATCHCCLVTLCSRIVKMSSSEDDNRQVETPPPLPNKKGRKYRREWEEANPWLDSVNGDVYRANCKACRRTFTICHGGVTDIKQHASGEQHTRCIRTQKTQSLVSQFFMTETSPEIDSVWYILSYLSVTLQDVMSVV